MSTPRKPDLDRLVTALTADGRPDELAGREAAVAAFRAASRRGTADGAARRRRVPFRRPFSALPPRLAAVGAVLVVAAGVVTAAYTQVLPGPAQDLAHTVFAPLGVPDSQQRSGHPAAVTISTSGGKSGTSSPQPGDGYRLTLTASRIRVPAGAVVELGGRVTDHGRPASDAPVQLFERPADSATWELVGSGVTGPRGGFRLLSPSLTATAVFRAVGPDNAHSATVRVAVVKPRLRLVWRATPKGQPPRDNNKHKPRDPGRTADEYADSQPERDEQCASRRPGEPGQDARRQQRVVCAAFQPRASAPPHGTDARGR